MSSSEYGDLESEDHESEDLGLVDESDYDITIKTPKSTKWFNKRKRVSFSIIILIISSLLIIIITFLPASLHSAGTQENLHLSIHNNTTLISGSTSFLTENDCSVSLYGCCPYEEALKHNDAGTNCVTTEELGEYIEYIEYKRNVICFIAGCLTIFLCLFIYCPFCNEPW